MTAWTHGGLVWGCIKRSYQFGGLIQLPSTLAFVILSPMTCFSSSHHWHDQCSDPSEPQSPTDKFWNWKKKNEESQVCPRPPQPARYQSLPTLEARMVCFPSWSICILTGSNVFSRSNDIVIEGFEERAARKGRAWEAASKFPKSLISSEKHQPLDCFTSSRERATKMVSRTLSWLAERKMVSI